MIKGAHDRRRGRHHRRPQRHRRRARQVSACPSAPSTVRRSRSRPARPSSSPPNELGIEIPHFCWHPDLAGRRQLPHVPGRDREDAQAPDRLQHAGDRGHGGATRSRRRPTRPSARRSSSCSSTTRSTARCATRPASATCRTSTWPTACTARRSSSRTRSTSARWSTSGPIVLDAERCVLCSRCIRFEREVTGTNLFEFVNRGDHTQIATYRDGADRPRVRRQPGRRLPGGGAALAATSASRCGSGS